MALVRRLPVAALPSLCAARLRRQLPRLRRLARRRQRQAGRARLRRLARPRLRVLLLVGHGVQRLRRDAGLGARGRVVLDRAGQTPVRPRLGRRHARRDARLVCRSAGGFELQQLCLLAAVGIEFAVLAWWRVAARLRAAHGRPPQGRRARQRRPAVPRRACCTCCATHTCARHRSVRADLASVAATTFYYQRLGFVGELVLDEAARRALEGLINFWQNSICAVLQWSRPVARCCCSGSATVLCVMPLASGLGFTPLGAVAHGRPVHTGVEVLRRMLQFAFDKPAREVLYTPLVRDDKYVSKAIVDTAGLRCGRPRRRHPRTRCWRRSRAATCCCCRAAAGAVGRHAAGPASLGRRCRSARTRSARVDLVAQPAALDRAVAHRVLLRRAQAEVARQFGVAAQHVGDRTLAVTVQEVAEAAPARRQHVGVGLAAVRRRGGLVTTSSRRHRRHVVGDVAARERAWPPSPAARRSPARRARSRPGGDRCRTAPAAGPGRRRRVLRLRRRCAARRRSRRPASVRTRTNGRGRGRGRSPATPPRSGTWRCRTSGRTRASAGPSRSAAGGRRRSPRSAGSCAGSRGSRACAAVRRRARGRGSPRSPCSTSLIGRSGRSRATSGRTPERRRNWSQMASLTTKTG